MSSGVYLEIGRDAALERDADPSSRHKGKLIRNHLRSLGTVPWKISSVPITFVDPAIARNPVERYFERVDQNRAPCGIFPTASI
jgi:hypothetical protein